VSDKGKEMEKELHRLRCEVADHLDAKPFKDWTPEMLQALLSLLRVAGVKPQQFVGKPKLTVVQGGA
jgi:hypothetical protein